MIKKIKKLLSRIDTEKLYRKTIFEKEYKMYDYFGEFTVEFKIIRNFSLAYGITYTVCVSDFGATRKNMYEAISAAVEHLYDDNPKYYRLKEHIMAKKGKL